MKAGARLYRRKTDVRLLPTPTWLRYNEAPSSNHCPAVDDLRRHEPELDSIPGELAAPYPCDLGETAAGNIHHSTNHRACACKFAATGSRGVDRFVPHCGRSRCAADDSRRGEAWLRYGTGSQLSALGGISHSCHDPATRWRGGMALRTQYLGVTAEGVGGYRDSSSSSHCSSA